MGVSKVNVHNLCEFTDAGYSHGNIYGTYVHGIFDEDGVADTIVRALYKAKGLIYNGTKVSRKVFKESQYDKLADMIRTHMDMDYIYKIMNLK